MKAGFRQQESYGLCWFCSPRILSFSLKRWLGLKMSTLHRNDSTDGPCCTARLW